VPGRPAILGPNGQPLRPATARPMPGGRRAVRGRYDSAETTEENARHWVQADGLSARVGMSPIVRRKLRERARYEIANNSYAKGMVETLANDAIGTGPRLQMLTGNDALNRRIEADYCAWADACGLAEKLRTMRKARAGDGEAFGLLIDNPRLPGAVHLDVKLIEADQVESPTIDPFDLVSSDGVIMDDAGNPVAYHVLKYHPGDYGGFGVLTFAPYDTHDAASVLHWYRADRAGQHRGVPEITPALGLFAQLRRFTLATITAAETAANMGAAVLQSAMPPDCEGVEGEPFETLDLERGMMTTLPAGYTLAQLKAEHPATTYDMFKREIINEIARCLNMPYNVAAGNSSDYNYASGRLDWQVYFRSIKVDQSQAERVVLDRILAAWLVEYGSVKVGRRPQPVDMGDWPHQWLWPGIEHVDPAKEATALEVLLRNGATTLTDHYNRQGFDVEDQLRKRAKERALQMALDKEFGLAAPAPPPAPALNAPPGPADPPTPPPPNTEAAMPARERIAASAPGWGALADPPAHATIRAEGPDRLRTDATGCVEIVAAKGEDGAPKRPRFDIVGYTGAVMSLQGFFSPVVIDLAGLKAQGQEIPALFGHDAERIVGQTDSIQIGKDVRLTGTITGDNEDADEVVSQAKNGFKWRASVGASIDRREFLDAGKTTTVNGREVAGPIVIARESTLLEISFVSIPADSQTTADVAASRTPGTHNGDHAMNFEQWLQAKGFDPAALTDAMKAPLRAAFDAEHGNAGANGAGNVQVAATAGVAGGAAEVRPDPARVQSLETIFAEQRQEDQRVGEITRVTAEALRDRPGMADELERMSRAAIEARRTTPAEYELLVLRATRARTAAPSRGSSAVHGGDARASARVIEAALCLGAGIEKPESHFDERTLEAAHARFRNGLGLNEVLAIAAHDNGWSGHSVRSDIPGVLHAAFPNRHIRAEGFSTLSLPNILSNVANKFLWAGFNAVEATWRAIAARRPVNDFKQITTAALTGGFMYEEVGASGELKHATAGELVYTNQVGTYGRLFSVTRRTSSTTTSAP
jgi:lambda family phage portal protein